MSKDLLFRLQSKVKERKIVDNGIIEYIDKIFSNKSDKVLEVLKRGIIKKIYNPSKRIIWIAIGDKKKKIKKKNEHLIYPKLYCSCQDFYKNVVVKRERDFCKHILAQIICEELNTFKTMELKDNDYQKLINELELKF
jgi:predicted nucleic acid-binding Zn finger protein